jgi:uncharacterized cupin superfamily protein
MVRTARPEEVPARFGGEAEPTWQPVRRHFGVQAFGINAWSAARAGGEVIEDHVERHDSPSEQEELYLVVAGRATFTVDGEQVDAPAGTFVFAPDPGSRRAAMAADPDTTVLAIGAPRGAAYEVSAWERRHFRRG